MKASTELNKFRAETLRAIGLGLTIPFGNNVLIYFCGFEIDFNFLKLAQFLISLLCLYLANQIIGYAHDLIRKGKSNV